MFKLLFVLFAACSLELQAGITYVDLQPDYLQSTSGNTTFDVDENGRNDLEFSFVIISKGNDVWFTLNTDDSVDVWIDTEKFLTGVKRIEPNVVIDADKNWKTDSNIPIAYLTTGAAEGGWPGSVDKYMAFRLKKNGLYYYGWLQMSLDSKLNNFTVTRYAFQNTPNTAITTGETGVASVNPPISNSNGISVKIADALIHITSSKDGVDAMIYNSAGIAMRGSQTASSEMDIDVSNLVAGLYFLKVGADNNVVKFIRN